MPDLTSSGNALRSDLPSAGLDVAKLRLELNEKSLEELVEDGVVKWDRERNAVKKGPHFDKERPLKS
ncbi:hypothetical protein ACFSBX_16670 [Halobellus rarus]|uniref:Uncharacterized protein n=1 Tax=Halobellus rarus TaxID=1126237 RepID=A0ABD6CSZ3_9EURY